MGVLQRNLLMDQRRRDRENQLLANLQNEVQMLQDRIEQDDTIQFPMAVVTERNRLLADVDMLQVQARRLRAEHHTNFWGVRSDMRIAMHRRQLQFFAAEAPGEIECGHRFPSTRPEAARHRGDLVGAESCHTDGHGCGHRGRGRGPNANARPALAQPRAGHGDGDQHHARGF